MTWSVSSLNFDALNEFEWYNIWQVGCFFYQVHKDSFSHFSLQKIPVWSFPVLCKVSLPSWQVRVKPRFRPMINGKSNPSYHLDICGCIRSWRHDIMIHRGFWGSWPPESPHQGAKNLMLQAAPELRVLRSLATVTFNGWEETTTRSWQYHKLTCLKHPELRTCIWLESKPKFNWSKWIQ